MLHLHISIISGNPLRLFLHLLCYKLLIPIIIKVLFLFHCSVFKFHVCEICLIYFSCVWMIFPFRIFDNPPTYNRSFFVVNVTVKWRVFIFLIFLSPYCRSFTNLFSKGYYVHKLIFQEELLTPFYGSFWFLLQWKVNSVRFLLSSKILIKV